MDMFIKRHPSRGHRKNQHGHPNASFLEKKCTLNAGRPNLACRWEPNVTCQVCQARLSSFFFGSKKSAELFVTPCREARRGAGCPKREWTSGKMERWFLPLILFGQSLVLVDAASVNAQNRSGQVIKYAGKTEVNAGFWRQANPKRPRQEDCEDRKEVQKESTMVRCTQLNGSTWSTEKKYMRRYKGTFDMFL